MSNLVDLVTQKYAGAHVAQFPDFRTGDTVVVHYRIKEGEKTRIQAFEGICIDIKEKNSINGHFCVRKISGGMGVERVFPYHSPNVTKIDVVNRGKSRRAKHYYLRELSGKAARVDVDYSRET